VSATPSEVFATVGRITGPFGTRCLTAPLRHRTRSDKASRETGNDVGDLSAKIGGSGPVRDCRMPPLKRAWPVEFVVIGGVPYAKADAIEMMEKPGGDRSLTLFFHLVATTLNLLVGAESECIADTVAAANAWLVSNPPGSGVHANSAAWKMADPWKDLLDAYNTGEPCAPKAD